MTAPNTEMSAVEIARRLAELGQAEKALKAYELALRQEDTAPADRFEAACAVLQYGEDYKIAYDAFLELYREGSLRADALSILTDAFYIPNEEQMKKRYEKNCKLLKKYPYIFRTDFLPFEELPIKFYPYDDNGVIPFYASEERFDPYIDFNEPVIRHYFFRDLEKPILAEEIVSHYELEYLRDNVRRSDWVAKENHIYLHYADWGVFCSHLQHWDLKPLLEDAKFVFLIGDEISQYPIDFKERFGIDYSQYSVKPLGIREIHKIVWHTQLYAHNGGDFFNEILHGHPYLLADTSSMFTDLFADFQRLYENAGVIAKSNGQKVWSDETVRQLNPAVLDELVSLRHRTLKDAVVTYYLGQNMFTRHLDKASRIVPAIIFQPHFGGISFNWSLHESGKIAAWCSTYESIKETGMLQQFRYIKVFTPMRRPTTSHAATVRFLQAQVDQGYTFSADTAERQEAERAKVVLMLDSYFDRIMNRSFMVSDSDRINKDSRVVRFEDGKLNGTATFTALAEFLDIPYTKSMTYCSDESGNEPVFAEGFTGFNPVTVYRTYDEFSDKYERALMEYLLRDAYEYYGYGFQYYDGKPMTQEEVEELLSKCHTNLDLVKNAYVVARDRLGVKYGVPEEDRDEMVRTLADDDVKRCTEKRLLTVRILRHGLSFCAPDGTPLRLMEPLKLDPALLQTELYR